ncbi:MAG: BatA domain-containing protein [Phycisphaerae bacterium]|jgi:hypothetical protein|nr:BatA domain-containing protein [Phycisphaerae bacterium]
MSFLSRIFLFALVAAGGPLIIHLLNRRRRRTIYWGPMIFLMEVIKRSRRILQIRDLLLLAVRTLVVILFVLAMSRPYWSAGADAGGSTQPMHAVIVIDNSLSMGYAEIDKTLLLKAKAKAEEFINALPSGSEMSIIPLCSESRWRDIYRTAEDAVEAVNRIEVVDRSVPIADGFSQARKACDQVRNLLTKRVVFIGDVQQRTWSLDGAETYLEGISDIQIVQVGSPERSNTWVAGFKLLHAIADTDSTAVFRAIVRHEGKPRPGVRVALTIDDAVVAERYVDLISGHELQLDFHHKFNVAGTSSSEPLFVPAMLNLTPDRLAMDDFRTLIVPVVARTPVLFIDQHGRNERPAENIFGETARVRKLLSSGSRDASGRKRLVRQVLRKIDEITRDDLKEARLVVIAGVESPTPESVALLREYVEQGGNIFIGAGETFDPARWTAMAWGDGAGILPAPLKDAPIGRLPQGSQTKLVSFRLDAPSVVGRALYLDTTPEETRSILNTPRFFKAIVADVSAARKAIAQTERQRIEKRRNWLEEHDKNLKTWSEQETAGKLSAADQNRRKQDRRKADAMNPRWLSWRNPLARGSSEFTVEEVVNLTQPRVLGNYTNGHPFVVERGIGKGRVVMVTTGMWPSWNTLALDNGVLLLDRIMRSLLVRSLPDRTFGAEKEIKIPVSAAHQASSFTVQRPGEKEPRQLSVEALGAQSYGLRLGSIQQRGVYSIRREGSSQKGADKTQQDDWSMVLAVNGPDDESELACRSENDMPDKVGKTSITWIGGDEKISLAGKSYIGHDFWWILMLLTLGCILFEMVLLTGWCLAGLPGKSAQDATDQTATPETTQ